MEFKKVGIIGLGTMGSNIAILCAKAGLHTLVTDENEENMNTGFQNIENFLSAGVTKSKLSTSQKKSIQSFIQKVTTIQELNDCDIIIEAIGEEQKNKNKLFKNLNSIVKEETIFASNTSTLSISNMGLYSGRPDRIIGTHFCLPAALNKTVEISPSMHTSEDTYKKTFKFLEKLGQIPTKTKDSPGFILNYFLSPFLNDCIHLIETGYTNPHDLDTAIKLGLGYKMGPMELLDIEGLDIHRTVSLSLYEQLKDTRYVPPDLVNKMIDSGHLGTKTGKGFYNYKTPGFFGTAEREDESLQEKDHVNFPPNIKKIGVVGLGTMGSGIAQVCLTSGFEVFGVEENKEVLSSGLGRIQGNLEIAVQRGKLDSSSKSEILTRLQGSTEIDSLAQCDLVIEVIIENLDAKIKIFKELDRIVKKDSFLATNTSCLSVTSIASSTNRPDKVLGLHFFNPPYAMKLVEVIQAIQTSEETFEFGKEFCKKIGKVPIPVQDRPGFLVNRLLIPYLNHAAQAFDNKLATREDMDRVISSGLGYPMGPLTLMDLVGIDVQTFVSDAMFEELGESRFMPPPILRRMTSAKWLGRKSGSGFYEYNK
mgnify:CR=1 FL=1